MSLFLGYDPGGKDKHGVAAVRIARDGNIEEEPETAVLRDAKAVCHWVAERSENAAALGIDTLLAWSRIGGRACDKALCSRYPVYSKSVIAQNALRSAMTINGIIVAQFGRNRDLPLFESHPKLFRKVWLEKHVTNANFMRCHDELLRKPNDHEADALVAAWCASRGYFDDWQVDLFKDFGCDLKFPAGTAVYPWPEPLGQ